MPPRHSNCQRIRLTSLRSNRDHPHMRIRRALLLVTIVALVAATMPAVAATPGERCRAAKLRAAAKKARARIQCYIGSHDAARSPDEACLQRVEARFATAWARIEA